MKPDAATLGRINAVPGMLAPEETEILFDLASQVVEGCIVEVGSYQGLSTISLALGSAKGKGVLVYAVDPQLSYTGESMFFDGPKNKAAFFSNILKSGVAELVSVVNLPSMQVVSGWRDPIGFIFIDGNHRYEFVKKDLECWGPHVISGGLAMLHDTHDQHTGPFRVVNEAIASGQWEKIGHGNYSTILRKR